MSTTNKNMQRSKKKGSARNSKQLSQDSTNSNTSTRSNKPTLVGESIIGDGKHGKPKADGPTRGKVADGKPGADGFIEAAGTKHCSPNKPNLQTPVPSTDKRNNNSLAGAAEAFDDSSSEGEHLSSEKEEHQPSPIKHLIDHYEGMDTASATLSRVHNEAKYNSTTYYSTPAYEEASGEFKENYGDEDSAADNVGGEELNSTRDITENAEAVINSAEKDKEEIDALFKDDNNPVGTTIKYSTVMEKIFKRMDESFQRMEEQNEKNNTKYNGMMEQCSGMMEQMNSAIERLNETNSNNTALITECHSAVELCKESSEKVEDTNRRAEDVIGRAVNALNDMKKAEEDVKAATERAETAISNATATDITVSDNWKKKEKEIDNRLKSMCTKQSFNNFKSSVPTKTEVEDIIKKTVEESTCSVSTLTTTPSSGVTMKAVEELIEDKSKENVTKEVLNTVSKEVKKEVESQLKDIDKGVQTKDVKSIVNDKIVSMINGEVEGIVTEDRVAELVKEEVEKAKGELATHHLPSSNSPNSQHPVSTGADESRMEDPVDPVGAEEEEVEKIGDGDGSRVEDITDGDEKLMAGNTGISGDADSELTESRTCPGTGGHSRENFHGATTNRNKETVQPSDEKYVPPHRLQVDTKLPPRPQRGDDPPATPTGGEDYPTNPYDKNQHTIRPPRDERTEYQTEHEEGVKRNEKMREENEKRLREERAQRWVDAGTAQRRKDHPPGQKSIQECRYFAANGVATPMGTTQDTQRVQWESQDARTHSNNNDDGQIEENGQPPPMNPHHTHNPDHPPRYTGIGNMGGNSTNNDNNNGSGYGDNWDNNSDYQHGRAGGYYNSQYGRDGGHQSSGGGNGYNSQYGRDGSHQGNGGGNGYNWNNPASPHNHQQFNNTNNGPRYMGNNNGDGRYGNGGNGNGGYGNGGPGGYGNGGYGNQHSPRTPISQRLFSTLTRKQLRWLQGIHGSPDDGIDMIDYDICIQLEIHPTAIDAHVSRFFNTREVLSLSLHSRKLQSGPQLQNLVKATYDSECYLQANTQLAFVTWYKQVAISVGDYGYAISDLEAVQLDLEKYGICVAGLGLGYFKKSGEGLMRILPTLLPIRDKDTEINSLIRQASAHNNGYELLFNIGYLLGIFDKSKTVTPPPMPSNENLWDYAILLNTYGATLRMRGQTLSEWEKMRMLFQSCVGIRRYESSALILLETLESVQPIDPQDGSPPEEWPLPLEFQMAKVIQRMESRTQNVVANSLSTNRRRLPSTSNPYYRRRSTPTANRVEGNIPMDEQRMDENSDDEFEFPPLDICLQGALTANRVEAKGPRRARSPPIPNPDRQRSSEEKVDERCDACGKFGHKAIRCWFLAAYLHIQKYLPHLSSEQRKELEAAWLEKNQKWAGGKRPSSVARSYAKKLFADIPTVHKTTYNSELLKLLEEDLDLEYFDTCYECDDE